MKKLFDDELVAAREDALASFIEENSRLLREGKVVEVENNIKYVDVECNGWGLSDCVLELKTILFRELIEQDDVDAIITMIEQMEMEEILCAIDPNCYPILKIVVERLDQSIWTEYDSNPEFVKWMQAISLEN